MPETESSGRPAFRALAARILGLCRSRWPALLVAGLIVFVPLSLLDVLTETELDDPDTGTLLAGLAVAAVGGFAAMIGEAIYSGMVAGVVVAERERRRGSITAVLGHLPYGRLLAVDVLAAGAILVGLLALVVPGLVFTAWFALAAPAVEIESLGVKAAFGRSRELVRGHVWFVLALLLPILIAQDALSSGLQSVSWWGIGDNFLGDWVGAILANLLTSPFYALTVTVLFFELRAPRA